MNDDADDVMRAGLHAEHLAIEHVRNGRNRVPVGSVKMGKRPNDIGKTQPAADTTGAIDVIVVVVMHPIEMRGLCKNNADQRCQAECDKNFCVLPFQAEAQTIHT
ncbi:MAG: hypothetical protein DMF04_12785 [Verrucomicrobia bacterium]|nr:MAG: hypothetical protein DMF04_12785 [Verrucomicrobiota bacterium]